MIEPKVYDLNDASEIRRLHYELWCYLHTSKDLFLNDCTDKEGRIFAYNALEKLVNRDMMEEKIMKEKGE